ncbi:DUF4124 domain-containing protein [Agaribacterium haliotis]|uniref:DUF4124 domain-containing protein n=1 Tax=Agaribacterium haliotis TaxID=2013869 RepID=UPI000BB575EB|nr:DUF4124 domain-containing protein [Agaribacterium haliotis]
MNLLPKLAVSASLLITAASLSLPSSAGEYWRWKGEDGVVHYGSTPPHGVEAERVTTRGDGSKSPSASNNSSADEQTGNDTKLAAQQQELKAQRQKECKAEQDRLSTLKSSGSRIRIQESDGSSRYLSPEEIAKEIDMSQQFLKDACGK